MSPEKYYPANSMHQNIIPGSIDGI